MRYAAGGYKPELVALPLEQPLLLKQMKKAGLATRLFMNCNSAELNNALARFNAGGALVSLKTKVSRTGCYWAAIQALASSRLRVPSYRALPLTAPTRLVLRVRG